MSFFEHLKKEAAVEWRVYIAHRFVIGLGDGTLPEVTFHRCLVQDYLFLIEFARAYAIVVYNSPQPSDMRDAALGLAAILDAR